MLPNLTIVNSTILLLCKNILKFFILQKTFKFCLVKFSPNIKANDFNEIKQCENIFAILTFHVNNLAAYFYLLEILAPKLFLYEN